MKLFQGFLLSFCVSHSAAFVISPTTETRQGIHQADSALRLHSWHDSDFYNSQNDVTRRPLHDKGRNNAAYPDFQEHFSASIYKRPGWSTYSPSVPIPPPAPATQPSEYAQAATQAVTQPSVYAQAATQAATQPAAPPVPVAPVAPPPVAQPAPTYAVTPVEQASAVMKQDLMDKRLESLEKNVEEIKLTLNYIAELLEKAQKEK